jgi:hypothetical protein
MRIQQARASAAGARPTDVGRPPTPCGAGPQRRQAHSVDPRDRPRAGEAVPFQASARPEPPPPRARLLPPRAWTRGQAGGGRRRPWGVMRRRGAARARRACGRSAPRGTRTRCRSCEYDAAELVTGWRMRGIIVPCGSARGKARRLIRVCAWRERRAWQHRRLLLQLAGRGGGAMVRGQDGRPMPIGRVKLHEAGTRLHGRFDDVVRGS